MSLTDSRRVWVALRDAGEEGVHSHEIRKRGLSGNPAQRMKDIVSHGQPVWTAREARNGRPGARYWLRDFAPDWAVPVKPNGADVGGSSSDNDHDEGRPVLLAESAADVSVDHGADVGGEVESPASSPGASPAADVSAEALVLDFTGEAVRGAEVLPHGTRVYRRAA